MEIAEQPNAPSCESRVTLWSIGQTFFRIGLTSFSLAALGEAAERLTKERKWFTEDEYLQGLGLAQALPGASTVNLFSYLGFRLRGLSGAAAATISFLIPSFLIAGSVSLGVVLLNLRFPALSRLTEIADDCSKSDVLPARIPDRAGAPLPRRRPQMIFLLFWLSLILTVDLAFLYRRPELMLLGKTFLQIGALTFGSGYAMLPFLQRAAVNHFGWITDRQFAVALALSLITPGPVTIVSVFIGYKVAGLMGALAGMVNIYFPSWALTTMVAAPYAKLSQLVPVRKVISGIVAAFIGTLLVVLIKIGADVLPDVPSMVLAGGAFAVQRFAKVDTVWIVLGGALLSLLFFR